MNFLFFSTFCRVSKVNVLLHGGETLFDSEWVQLADLFQSQWPETLQNILFVLSPEDEAEQMDGGGAGGSPRISRSLFLFLYNFVVYYLLFILFCFVLVLIGL